MPPAGFETAIPTDPRFRTRGYWDRQLCVCVCVCVYQPNTWFMSFASFSQSVMVIASRQIYLCLPLRRSIIFCDAETQVVANCSSSKRNNWHFERSALCLCSSFQLLNITIVLRNLVWTVRRHSSIQHYTFTACSYEITKWPTRKLIRHGRQFLLDTEVVRGMRSCINMQLFLE
jgi:hypothetical protein